MGTTIVGGAATIELELDSTTLRHIRLGHKREHGMMELHKKKLLKGIKICMYRPPSPSRPGWRILTETWGRSIYFFLFSELLNFLFQKKKCRDPNPWPDPNGGSKPKPGLLRRFHLSYQNILLCHFVVEAVSVLGKPIIIYKFNAIQ